MSREHVFFSGEYAQSDQFIDLESGQIPAMFLLDSNTLYGNGVFEGIRIYNGRIFKLVEHLDRLWNSAAYLEIELPYTKRELTEILRALCRKNEITGTGYIRLVVTRGHRKDLGINTRMVYKPTVFIIARSLQLYPKELYDKGLSVIIAKVRRPPSC